MSYVTRIKQKALRDILAAAARYNHERNSGGDGAAQFAALRREVAAEPWAAAYMLAQALNVESVRDEAVQDAEDKDTRRQRAIIVGSGLR